MFQWLFGAPPDVRCFGAARSSKWPKIRKEHLKKFPTCAACGTNKGLEVHHVLPFWKFPELELSTENLITLCDEGGRQCHFRYGHGFNWSQWGESVTADAAASLLMLARMKR